MNIPTTYSLATIPAPVVEKAYLVKMGVKSASFELAANLLY
jgi:hypothetical protein